MSDKPLFTPEEISHIDKNMRYIVFDWAKHLIQHILSIARKNNVSTVYMNTSKTVDSGNTQEMKLDYFYEKLPQLMGFQLEKVNLRGKTEKLWAYHLNEKLSAQCISIIKTANVLLQNIPKKYQGAFIGILGRKPEYTNQEIEQIIELMDKRKKEKPKSFPKYYYDWESKQNNSQLFKKIL